MMDDWKFSKEIGEHADLVHTAIMEAFGKAGRPIDAWAMLYALTTVQANMIADSPNREIRKGAVREVNRALDVLVRVAVKRNNIDIGEALRPQ
jgi:hypothetical protein